MWISRMTTAAPQANPELLRRVTELQQKLSDLQQELQALACRSSPIQVSLPGLHDKATGRIDAQRVASYMGAPLAKLAQALQLNYKAIHRNPSVIFILDGRAVRLPL
jgi:hypothetical protein